MNLIDAFWDTENLGVQTYELIIHNSDILDEVKAQCEQLMAHKSVYCVVKAPSARFDIYEYLCTAGFVFNESLFAMRVSKSEFVHTAQALGGLFDPMQFCPINSDNLHRLIAEIENGLFFTDRIALNPAFGIELANTRYKNWIVNCLTNSDYLIEESAYNGIPTGFGMYHMHKPLITGLLGAAYKTAAREGYFINGMFTSLEKFFSGGFRAFEAKISSNNTQVLKVYQKLGVRITDINYVFTFTRI